MKALVKTKIGKNNIELRELDEPSINDNMVKIKVLYAGICGTDLSIKRGKQWCNPPVVLGHEFSGEVVEIGDKVTKVKIGDKVVSETAQYVCGKCEKCMSGKYLMCKDRLSIGYGTDGAMADYIKVREEIVHKLPGGVKLDEAALAEPSAVAYHAVFDHVQIKPKDKIAVFGPGTIGILVSQLVNLLGAEIILCGLDSDNNRLELAENIGIKTLNLEQDSFEKYVERITKNEGLDYIFDCSGSQVAIDQGLNSLRNIGTLIQVGLTKNKLDISYNLLPLHELSIKGSFGHTYENWEGVIDLINRKKINTKKLISKKYKLQDWEVAFKEAENPHNLKILFEF